ncbi:hypothetical protein [Pseudochryseolinea flava]|uniref:Uncharacterized protein n=1 Tax=Pseudochryseolinea flava TaxID=2059302 RepID=A0A364XWQ8_9BACT|nr:hypothetical protein [Pseudochryseolinea flava]RAV98809.1 hypothetical protein DQQ10_22605 [Pseudochryseolinea flava]
MKAMRLLISAVLSIFMVTVGLAQQTNDDRMNRDIEVAENVLATLIKQQFSKERNFLAIEVDGNYQAGYGITFTIPTDFTVPIIFSDPGDMMIYNSGSNGGQFQVSNPNNEDVIIGQNPSNNNASGKDTEKLQDRASKKRRLDMDSVRESYHTRVLDAAKTFLADYSDLLTAVPTGEKIMITNQGAQQRMYNLRIFGAQKRTLLSAEAQKSDLVAYKQGKLTRPQLLAKIKLTNTQTVDEVEPDLELLSSIFNRLYRADLSKTYFTEDNIYYEHLKNFGVIFYMQTFSTNGQQGYDRYDMPTVGLSNIDLDTRNKKVTELYPKFEQELKENILEYGKTVKSLKDDESLIFQARITRCPECGIPASLELNIKATVLKDLAAGKIDKTTALSKIIVKKGANQ